jgi:hypothetical protein
MLAVLRNPVKPPVFVILAFCLFFGGCRSRDRDAGASIEFDKVPPTGQGGPVPLSNAAGRVKGTRPGEKIVLYAKDVNGIWWVQPQAIQPFITVKSDSTWETATHLGTDYAAILVDPGYRPPATTNALPVKGGKVVAIATVKGVGPLVQPTSRIFQFSGYDWKAVDIVSERNGTPNLYDPQNVSMDSNGHLHLHIVRKDNRWTCSEVILQHSFGYGTYLFSVENISHQKPAAVLTLFTWDALGAEQNHREMDVEISRWGDPAGKNAQFVVQPYYVPENVARFIAPAGPLTYSFEWEPTKISFRAVRGTDAITQRDAVAAHVFSSGIPSPGGESASMNFCAFSLSKVPLDEDAEIVIDKFQYLP